MEKRTFAGGALEVPVIGLGGGALGDEGLDDASVDRLLGTALELGVDLIDTAPSYGRSERRIGQFLRGRRDRVLLSTKVGYGVAGVEDWTAECIRLGVDKALRELGTEVLDIVHLHSCPAQVLEQGEVPEALVRAVQAGKVRVAAYSGDGHPLYVATKLPGFGGVQASMSLCDRNNGPTLRIARGLGYGTIAKRALANAPWRHRSKPSREDEAEQWSRWQRLGLDMGALDPTEVFVRWAVHHAGVDCTLVGTRSPERLRAAVDAAGAGPLPEALLGHVDARWAEVGRDWMPLT